MAFTTSGQETEWALFLQPRCSARNVYFIAWTTVSALRALFVLLRTLRVAALSLMLYRTNKVID